MSNDVIDLTTKPGPMQEYTALRSEILKRIELRQQLISITLTLAGAFLAIGVTTELVVLVYPPLAAFLAFGWAQNDFRIRELATYIRNRLETIPLGLGYETYVQIEAGRNKGLGAWRIIVISHSGIFILTQLMALGIELARDPSFNFTLLKWVLLLIDCAAVLAVAWVVRQARR